MKSDAELMLDFRQGNREAFEKLVMRHQVGLFNFFLRLLGNRETAEDQTQEVFFRVYLHADDYENTAKFTTYLYRIARNCWIDSLRKSKRRSRVDSLDKENEKGATLYDQIPAPSDAPDRQIQQEDRSTILHSAVESLPDEQRVVFVLSEVQGMKYAEISETLGIPVGTVKSRMHVAITKLREYLARRGITGKG